jgi:hypothetical protein
MFLRAAAAGPPAYQCGHLQTVLPALLKQMARTPAIDATKSLAVSLPDERRTPDADG